jgi:hypothetical protein
MNMHDGLKKRKNMEEEAVVTWLEGLFVYLTRGTDANREEPQTEQLVSGPMFNSRGLSAWQYKQWVERNYVVESKQKYV